MKNYTLVIQGLESLLAEAYEAKDKKSAAKILKIFKENKELSKLYSIVDNLKKGDVNETTVDQYINENISFAKRVDYSKIEFPFEKNMVSENDFYNHVGTILFEEKSAFNINSYNKAYQAVKNHLLDEIESKKRKSSTARKISEAIESVDSEDKMLVESFIKTPSNERQNLFESLKSECISNINKHISECENPELKVKMYETKDVILEMSFKAESYISDMLKIHDLNKNLK